MRQHRGDSRPAGRRRSSGRGGSGHGSPRGPQTPVPLRFQTRREVGDGYVRLGNDGGEGASITPLPPEPDLAEEICAPVVPQEEQERKSARAKVSAALLAPSNSSKAVLRGAAAAAAPRLVSLDAFRGFTIAGMLLVNNTAVDDAVPAQFAHAAWGDPITFADLIFPWFLFIVGVAIPFSANGRREAGKSRWQRALLTLQRTAILFGVGLLLDSSLQHAAVFQLGVLQLIALAYLCGRSLYRIPPGWRTLVAAALLGGYGAALALFHPPGQMAGEFSEQHNLVQHLNDTIFGRFNLDGLPSVMPTAALVLLGTVAGDLIRNEKWGRWRRAGYLAMAGAFLVSVGWLWGHFLIMNKPFWTPPYICYAAGWGAVGLAFLYTLADIQRLRLAVWPLVVLGSNALVAYAGAILFKVYVLQAWTTHSPLTGKTVALQQGALDWCVQHAGDRVIGGWCYTAGYIGVWWLVCLLLYKRKIFVRA